jgi:hypothetical protein
MAAKVIFIFSPLGNYSLDPKARDGPRLKSSAGATRIRCWDDLNETEDGRRPRADCKSVSGLKNLIARKRRISVTLFRAMIPEYPDAT